MLIKRVEFLLALDGSRIILSILWLGWRTLWARGPFKIWISVCDLKWDVFLNFLGWLAQVWYWNHLYWLHRVVVLMIWHNLLEIIHLITTFLTFKRWFHFRIGRDIFHWHHLRLNLHRWWDQLWLNLFQRLDFLELYKFRVHAVDSSLNHTLLARFWFLIPFIWRFVKFPTHLGFGSGMLRFDPLTEHVALTVLMVKGILPVFVFERCSLAEYFIWPFWIQHICISSQLSDILLLKDTLLYIKWSKLKILPLDTVVVALRAGIGVPQRL